MVYEPFQPIAESEWQNSAQTPDIDSSVGDIMAIKRCPKKRLTSVKAGEWVQPVMRSYFESDYNRIKEGELRFRHLSGYDCECGGWHIVSEDWCHTVQQHLIGCQIKDSSSDN